MSKLPAHIDLHLVRILYMLLSERNVTRVALKLNQPQPSISASLRKLRELTGDPLLVRGSRGMVPTERGESLLRPAKRILDETERMFLARKPFVASEEARTFHLAAPDFLDSRFLPDIVARVRRDSPRSRIVIHGIGRDVDYLKLLSDGDLDVIIANWDDPPPHLHMSRLFQDPIACAMHASSPYAKRTGPDEMTVEDYLALPHVAPTPSVPGYLGVIDSWLERHDMRRNVVVESCYFGQMPYMLTQSDLVLTTGRQFLRFYEKKFPLKLFTVPVRFPPMRFYQLWHDRVHHASEHKWLRGIIAATAKALAV